MSSCKLQLYVYHESYSVSMIGYVVTDVVEVCRVISIVHWLATHRRHTDIQFDDVEPQVL